MFKKKKSPQELDVDVRFLLANERTLLAWIRTGLTLIAGGIAITFLPNDSAYSSFVGLGAIIVGGALSLVGYSRYLAADRAIRSGNLPPRGLGAILVVIIILVFSSLLLTAHLLDS